MPLPAWRFKSSRVHHPPLKAPRIQCSVFGLGTSGAEGAERVSPAQRAGFAAGEGNQEEPKLPSCPNRAPWVSFCNPFPRGDAPGFHVAPLQGARRIYFQPRDDYHLE